MLNTTFSILVWFLAALTFALSIAAPNGYSVGTTIIFLLSFGLFFLKPRWLELHKEDKMLFYVFALYACAMFGFVYLDGWHTRELDRPSRFILALPVLLLLLRSAGRENLLWFGTVIGAIAAFVLAIYERKVLGLSRANGSEHPIMFGNIGMMLGLISFASATYFLSNKRYVWLMLAILGGLCGIGASVLSASRGGWVALPLIGFFLLWQSRFLLGKKLVWGVCIVSILLVFIAVLIPQTGIKDRVGQAVHDVVEYDQGVDKDSSVGLRFEMWKAALSMFAESPLVGVGEYGSVAVKEKLIAEGAVSAKVLTHSHAHNEFINALGLTGIIGFIFLLAVYLIPLQLFLKKMRQYPDNWNIRAYAIAGALVPMCYMDFGLSQVMFSHNIGVMMYAFPIVYFWAAVRWAERKELAR
ncbi:O-antigen ligase family protein [Marinomonas shanghaiensis]|uniref:O-antigen ligase family protein n=1 Tax=Marinomonas shanghaiensis TaxID=2202418 RepID=UPI000DB9B727|nr:O-antigen ligase family protein [Marinomonas shanghaiensis]